MSKRLIISIDGGGIRGIIPLVILRTIQLGVSKNLNAITSAWYGTSTGSVIAAGLLVQREQPFLSSIQNVLDIYEFRSTSMINPLGASNPGRALYKLLDENFGSFDFGRFPNLHVITTQTPAYKPEIFSLRNNTNVANALKASCAVPGVFDAVTIGEYTYVDGFLVAKSPAGIAIQEENLDDDLILLSLGTGILREVDDIEKQVRETHLNLEALSKEKGFHYFRMNPHLELAADDMQNTSLKNIFNLRKDAENFLKLKETRFNTLVTLLQQV